MRFPYRLRRKTALVNVHGASQMDSTCVHGTSLIRFHNHLSRDIPPCQKSRHDHTPGKRSWQAQESWDLTTSDKVRTKKSRLTFVSNRPDMLRQGWDPCSDGTNLQGELGAIHLKEVGGKYTPSRRETAGTNQLTVRLLHAVN